MLRFRRGADMFKVTLRAAKPGSETRSAFLVSTPSISTAMERLWRLVQEPGPESPVWKGALPPL